MRPLIKREKKNPEDFSWLDLLYVPESPRDWFGISCLVLIFVLGVFTLSSVARYNRHEINYQIEQSKNQEIAALKHLTSATLLQYLTGFWQVGNTSKFVEVRFSDPKEGVIVFPSSNGPKKIPIKVISDSPPVGSVTFALKDGSQGTIKKVWNKDAITIEMPYSKPITLHYMLSSPSLNR